MKNPGTLILPFFLALTACVVTGCPHNEYLVRLKPQGSGLERTLDFYCSDGVNTNTGMPNYQAFSPGELAAITGTYPPGSVTSNGLRYTAHAVYTNQLPADVGGAGAYTHYATSLGESGFYSERFRGNDDLAGVTERRFKAADRFTDLTLGWFQAELGQEPGYGQLRGFLDVDFRRDLKNLSTYWWEGQLISRYQTNATEEFIVRFGQYLWEHQYFKIGEIPDLLRAARGSDAPALLGRLQRLVAAKLGLPETGKLPASLAFLADEKILEASLDKYLSGTDPYQARLKQWEAEKMQNPDAPKPEPNAVVGETLAGLVEFDRSGHSDSLEVRLSLAAPPVHSNGRWDEALKQVVWKTDLMERTNAAVAPLACYASWAQADDTFQARHFGKTAVAGDQLAQYCILRNSLDASHGAEWDTFVSSLAPGDELAAKLDAFHFSDEPANAGTNREQTVKSPAVQLRELVRTAL